jgi:hypothetical protein
LVSALASARFVGGGRFAGEEARIVGGGRFAGEEARFVGGARFAGEEARFVDEALRDADSAISSACKRSSSEGKPTLRDISSRV